MILVRKNLNLKKRIVNGFFVVPAGISSLGKQIPLGAASNPRHKPGALQRRSIGWSKRVGTRLDPGFAARRR